MDPSKILHEPWIDRLVAEPESDRRLSLSLEALMHLTGTRGVSQWIEVEPGEFRCMRERGLTDDSLTGQIIELVASGEWEARRPQSLVLFAGQAPQRLAWALSTPTPEGDVLNSAEAFLFLVGVLHPPTFPPDSPSLLPFMDFDDEDFDV